MKVCIPAKLQSPNVKQHWAKAYQRNKKLGWVVRQYLNFEQERPSLPVTVVITSHRSREFDYDNLVASCKFLADTIADCLIPGLAPGQADSSKQITFVYRQAKCKRGEEAVEIEITPSVKSSDPLDEIVEIAQSLGLYTMENQ